MLFPFKSTNLCLCFQEAVFKFSSVPGRHIHPTVATARASCGVENAFLCSYCKISVEGTTVIVVLVFFLKPFRVGMHLCYIQKDWVTH